MSTRRPFDDLVDLFKQLPTASSMGGTGRSTPLSDTENMAQEDFSQVLEWLAAWQRTANPKLAESHICVFVSSYSEHNDQDSLAGFIEDAGRGQVPVSKLCKERGVGLRVLEMAPKIPHIVSDGWPEKDCMAATAFGMEATAVGGDILGLASIAPGSEHYCPMLCQQLIDNFILRKQNVMVIKRCDTPSTDILDLMRKSVGREVVAMVGALIAARSRSLPVLVEGWSGLTALSILMAIDRASADHVKVASIEDGKQAAFVDMLGMQPIIGPQVNLGAGCGIALALSAIAPVLNLVE